MSSQGIFLLKKIFDMLYNSLVKYHIQSKQKEQL